MARRSASFLLGTAVVAALLAIAAPAQAHNYLVTSTPAEGAVLTVLPAEFSVTTNEPLLALDDGTPGFALQVIDSTGAYYGDGCLIVSGATVSTPAALGAPGDYRLSWQVVSGDGHPVSGELLFSWQGDASSATPGSATPPVCGEASSEPEPTSTVDSDAASTTNPAPVSAPENTDGRRFNPGPWIAGGVLAAALAAIGVSIALVRWRRSKA